MQCPACNHLNSAMSVRCERCQSTLIHEAGGHSAAYHAAAGRLDGRVYGGAGAVFGFVLTYLALRIVTDDGIDDRRMYSCSAIGALAGSLLARLFLRLRRREGL